MAATARSRRPVRESPPPVGELALRYALAAVGLSSFAAAGMILWRLAQLG